MKNTLAGLMWWRESNPNHWSVRWTFTIGMLVLVGWAATCAVRHGATSCQKATLSSAVMPSTLAKLLSLTPDELRQVDIGLVNLLCATGLSGTKDADPSAALAELDRMALQVRTETQRHYRKFQAHPEEFNGSEAYFRLLCLATVLQQDFGIHYNPTRARPNDGAAIEPNETFFANAKDIFLQGLVGSPRAGTCASLPVLYVAVGRRLGYPLKLVAAKHHLLARWEGARERLNIEATTVGLSTFEDEYYRHWPFAMTADEERTERYLASLSPAEELAIFLSLRAQCVRAAGRWDEALVSQEHVSRLVPHSVSQREILQRDRKQAKPLQRRELTKQPH